VQGKISAEESAPALFAQVALALPLDAELTYAVPVSLHGAIAVGMRAEVPLRGRTETGYVTAIARETTVASPKYLLTLPDAAPLFSGEMLELCRWLADYYCCSLGEALHCAAPSGLRTAKRMLYRLVPDMLGRGRLTEPQKQVVAVLGNAGALSEAQIVAGGAPGKQRAALKSLLARGVVAAEADPRALGVSIRSENWVVLDTASLLAGEAVTALLRRAPKQGAVYLDLLHGAPERRAGELQQRHDAPLAVLRELEKRGLVRIESRELYRSPSMALHGASTERFALNSEQKHAYTQISNALDAGRYETFLLRGITGSGKTEVYLQVMERALAAGKTALMLVPEISLTPQTVGRLYARFSQDIAVLHSGLSQGERYDEWRRAQRGEVRIVVGARSAIFAPLKDLGLIIVDEEHDSSYKQSDVPRYHARDVAVMRAHLCKAVCVLGSATPSIESSHNAAKDKFTRIDLNHRATRGSLPTVRLVDMRIETKETNGQIVLSRVLEEAVHARIARREQIILLLNRRGFAPYVLCPQCGWVAECDNCQVSLTYHSNGAEVRCHYCGLRRDMPEVCGECGFNPLLYLGTGTQKAEDYLLRTFASARIERMDADTTSEKGGHARILGRFATGEIDILLGTQMLAKGHDYPGVTLVGVINADTGLALPDFRAAEQSFQLLTQVGGRAGRGENPGEVIIQTFRPKHYAIQAAAAHDYDAFFATEIQHREKAGYPPFRRMASLLIESEDPEAAQKYAFALRRLAVDQVEGVDFKGVEIVGPSPAVLRRINKKYRWTLALLSRSAQRLNKLARILRVQFAAQPGASAVQLKIDLDPYGMY